VPHHHHHLPSNPSRHLRPPWQPLLCHHCPCTCSTHLTSVSHALRRQRRNNNITNNLAGAIAATPFATLAGTATPPSSTFYTIVHYAASEPETNRHPWQPPATNRETFIHTTRSTPPQLRPSSMCLHCKSASSRCHHH